MITLAEMGTDEEGIVKSVHAEGELKQRLFSFGLHKGSHFKIKAMSIGKSTVEIEVGRARLALRHSEAQCIEVERV